MKLRYTLLISFVLAVLIITIGNFLIFQNTLKPTTYLYKGKVLTEDVSKRQNNIKVYPTGNKDQYVAITSVDDVTLGEAQGLTSSSTAYITKDCMIESGTGASSNQNGYNSGALLTQGAGGSHDIERILINPTLPSLTGTISDVKLYLWLYNENSSGAAVSVHTLNQTAWTETGVTWNTYDGTNAWTVAGGDYNATMIYKLATTSSNVLQNFPVMGASALNPLTLTWGQTFHLLLKMTDETINEFMAFRGREYSSVKPYLEITYTAAVASTAAPKAILFISE